MFYVAKENGSILLSCRTTMQLGLIKPHAQLKYLPPKASLLTSTYDQPSKTKTHKPIIYHMKEKPNMVSIPEDNQLITRKEQIIERFPDVFEGIGKFLGKPYNIQLDPKVPPNKLHVGLFLYISTKLSGLKLTKCSSQVSLNLFRRPHHGLIALCLLKGLTNKANPNSGYV